MPIVQILGIPDRTEGCEELIDSIREAVAGVKALGVKKEQVTVFLVRDHVQKDLGEELVGIVEGLYRKPGRTSEVRQGLADTICETLLKFAARYLPQCECVEVCTNSTNVEEGGHKVMPISGVKGQA